MKIATETQFEIDLAKSMSVNNGQMSIGVWNLIITIRDVKLFCKGIIVNRHFKLKNVKAYFGVSGGKEKVLEQLEKILAEIKAEK